MKAMKIFLTAAAICLCLTACGGKSSAPETPFSAAETTAATAADTTASAQTTTAPSPEIEARTDTESASAAAPETSADPEVSEGEQLQQLFDAALEGVITDVRSDSIYEEGTVGGVHYSLTLDLQKWEHFTTAQQMVELSRLFWQSYPRMYARFADITDPPVDVILAIENDGYEIAEAWEDHVHLHDQWLWQNPDDYDCITHELAHIIQHGWDADFLEYSDYIERFADCCRYEYALDGGYFNDAVWTLQTPEWESTREKSVRFLVWLDALYSDADTDFLRNYAAVCYSMAYPSEEWDAAWAEIFTGTALEGKSVDAVWEEFEASDFAYLSSYADFGKTSELLAQYPVRENIPQ